MPLCRGAQMASGVVGSEGDAIQALLAAHVAVNGPTLTT